MALVLFLIIVVGTSVQLQACRLGVFFHAFGFYQLCLLRFVISLYGLNETCTNPRVRIFPFLL